MTVHLSKAVQGWERPSRMTSPGRTDGGAGVERQVAVLVVDGSDFSAGQRFHGPAEGGSDELRLGQSFIEREVPLAGVEDGQAGLGLRNDARPAVHARA